VLYPKLTALRRAGACGSSSKHFFVSCSLQDMLAQPSICAIARQRIPDHWGVAAQRHHPSIAVARADAAAAR